MIEYAIQTNDLCKYYSDQPALHKVNLNIPAAGISAIVGSNGAGKSTLFRVLLGLLKPTSGTSTILNCNSQQLTSEIRQNVGLVNEEHALPAWLKVSVLADMHRSMYVNWDESLYQDVVSNFNVSPKQKISQLSRGERAGVNLAMALAQQPKVLILDEPTLGLDVVAKRCFLESLLFSREQNDCAIVYCSHIMEEIERVADYLIVMEQGEIKNQSPPEEFVQRVGYWIAQYNELTPKFDQLPGILNCQCIEGEYHLIVLDQAEQFKQALLKSGASHVYSAPINLDKAVNGFLAKNHISNKKRSAA